MFDDYELAHDEALEQDAPEQSDEAYAEMWHNDNSYPEW